jgi:hypothetical protein
MLAEVALFVRVSVEVFRLCLDNFMASVLTGSWLR